MNFSKTNGGLKPTEWGVFCTRNHGELTIWNKSHGNSSYNDAEIERTFSPWNQFSQTRNPIINVGFSSQQGGILPWIHCYIYICIQLHTHCHIWKILKAILGFNQLEKGLVNKQKLSFWAIYIYTYIYTPQIMRNFHSSAGWCIQQCMIQQHSGNCSMYCLGGQWDFPAWHPTTSTDKGRYPFEHALRCSSGSAKYSGLCWGIWILAGKMGWRRSKIMGGILSKMWSTKKTRVTISSQGSRHWVCS